MNIYNNSVKFAEFGCCCYSLTMLRFILGFCNYHQFISNVMNMLLFKDIVAHWVTKNIVIEKYSHLPSTFFLEWALVPWGAPPSVFVSVSFTRIPQSLWGGESSYLFFYVLKIIFVCLPWRLLNIICYKVYNSKKVNYIEFEILLGSIKLWYKKYSLKPMLLWRFF